MSKELVSNDKKWAISFISAIFFIIISSPQMFCVTNNIFKTYFNIETVDKFEKPTWWGIFLHGIVFMIITRLSMNYNMEDQLLNMLKK
jgi:hypothetical protein